MLEAEGSTSASDQLTTIWTIPAAWRIVRQRHRLALALAAGCFFMVALVTFLVTPQYRASAHVLIERATPNVLDSEDVVPTVRNDFEIKRFYETQYALLRDTVVLRAALDRHGIRESLSRTIHPEDAEDGEPLPDDERICEWLESRLDIGQKKQSNIITISFLHPSPHVAADVVNAVVESYRDLFVTSGIDARRDASQFLNERIEEAQADVLSLQRVLARQRTRGGEAIPAGEAEMNSARLSSLDESLTEAKTRRAAAEARVQVLSAAEPLDVPEIRENARVSWYYEQLAGLQKERAELEGRFGAAWPRLIELAASIEEVQATLSGELESLYEQSLGSAGMELGLARQNEQRLARLLAAELSSASDDEVNAADHEALRNQYEQKRAALNRLLQRREDVALSVDLENILTRQVTVLETASPPKRPAQPKVVQNLLVGLLFGLFLGVSATFAAEAIDNKIRSSTQLVEISDLPLLASIPRVDRPPKPRLIYSRRRPRPSPRMLVGQRELDEAFRALRSTLMLAQPGGAPRSLLVTSAIPSEGKSTVASRLAHTLAAFGQRVVLIDADLRRPQLHRLFRTPSDRGLTNALVSPGEDVGTLVQPTRFENLYVLPVGPRPPDPATLIDGARFSSIIDELTSRLGFECVIIDTPPVLVFSDVYSIAPVVERSILVARSMHTPKDALRQAIEALRKVNARLTGVVFNGAVFDQRAGAYYRYYHDDREDPAADSGPAKPAATRRDRRATGA